jgi:hypothetical protein
MVIITIFKSNKNHNKRLVPFLPRCGLGWGGGVVSSQAFSAGHDHLGLFTGLFKPGPTSYIDSSLWLTT